MDRLLCRGHLDSIPSFPVCCKRPAAWGGRLSVVTVCLFGNTFLNKHHISELSEPKHL